MGGISVRDDFVLFIISHERADRVETYSMFRNAGYTGRICIVLDSEDSEIDKYHERFKNDELFIYDKEQWREYTEVCSRVNGCATYARNAVEWCAKQEKLRAFIVADDDLLRLRFRYDDNGVLRSTAIKSNLDEIINTYIDFIVDLDIACVSFGTANSYMRGLTQESISNNRLPFNCFFRNNAYDWTWKSEIYEDAVTSILESWNGDFAMQLPFIQCDMAQMDVGAKGGMTDVYMSISNYEKNMPVLLYAPSCVKLSLGKRSFIYQVSKKNAFPKLISSSCKGK